MKVRARIEYEYDVDDENMDEFQVVGIEMNHLEIALNSTEWDLFTSYAANPRVVSKGVTPV